MFLVREQLIIDGLFHQLSMEIYLCYNIFKTLPNLTQVNAFLISLKDMPFYRQRSEAKEQVLASVGGRNRVKLCSENFLTLFLGYANF